MTIREQIQQQEKEMIHHIPAQRPAILHKGKHPQALDENQHAQEHQLGCQIRPHPGAGKFFLFHDEALTRNLTG